MRRVSCRQFTRGIPSASRAAPGTGIIGRVPFAMEIPMQDEIVSLPDAQPVLRVMPLPADLNAFGDIFGGWVMAQVDIAGAIPAMRRARGRVATVAVNAIQLRQPISAGDLVSFYAEVIKIGRTSLTVDVQVFAERHPENPLIVKVTEAVVTYVALEKDGRKRLVPPQE